MSPSRPTLTPLVRLMLGIAAIFLAQGFSPFPETGAFTATASFSLGPSLKPPEDPVYFFAKLGLSELEKLDSRILDPKVFFGARTEPRKYYRVVSVKSYRSDSNAMLWPVMGSISSGFGYRKHPFTRRRSFHAAVDIRSKYGSPVICPVDGMVTYAGRAGANGKLIKVKGPNGVLLSFAHLRDFKCDVGQRVKRGSVIGTVGSTGRATGPHLHFAVQKYGQYIDPTAYLGKRSF